jgi:hypothetical protein
VLEYAERSGGAYPRTMTRISGQQQGLAEGQQGADVLKGQISVGMFLSWRMRWETVWAVRRQFMAEGDMWTL